jgi:hypothetical protein
MIDYREALRPEFQTGVLHRLEGAAGEVEERGAGYAFRGCAEADCSSSNYLPQFGNSILGVSQ